MAHSVIISVANPKRFVYLNLGDTYKDRKGRKHTLLDINGDPMEFEMRSPAMSLDIDDDHENTIYQWLKNNPSTLGKITIKDTIETQIVATENMIASAEAIQIAIAMSNAELKDFAKLTGIRTKDNSIEFIKAQIIKMANDNPEKFQGIMNDRDKDYRVFIEKAIDADLLAFRNGTYKYNKETIGLNDDAVIIWLKENKDIYALLRKELKKVA